MTTREPAIDRRPRRRKPLWTAGPDGLAHATDGSYIRHSRTFCGRLALDERYAWPEQSRCPFCAAAAELREVPTARR